MHHQSVELLKDIITICVATKMSELPIKNKIRELRFFADEMTQQELAELVGVTRQTVMAVEKCKHSPTLEVAFKIAEIFGQSIDEVFQYQSSYLEKTVT